MKQPTLVWPYSRKTWLVAQVLGLVSAVCVALLLLSNHRKPTPAVTYSSRPAKDVRQLVSQVSIPGRYKQLETGERLEIGKDFTFHNKHTRGLWSYTDIDTLVFTSKGRQVLGPLVTVRWGKRLYLVREQSLHKFDPNLEFVKLDSNGMPGELSGKPELPHRHRG